MMLLVVRLTAALTGAGLLVAGWYVSMSAGIGAVYGEDLRPMMAVAGLTWMLAGIAAIVASGGGRTLRAPAAATHAIAGTAVVVTAIATEMLVAVAPGALLIAAAHGTMVASLHRREASRADTRSRTAQPPAGDARTTARRTAA